MAAQLKSNTLAIEGRLKERGQLLDSTEAALDTSLRVRPANAALPPLPRPLPPLLPRQCGKEPLLGSIAATGQEVLCAWPAVIPTGSPPRLQKTRESKERATEIHRRGRANFCLTCLIMLVVGLTFAGGWVGGGRAGPHALQALAVALCASACVLGSLPSLQLPLRGSRTPPSPVPPLPAAMYMFIKVTRFAGYRATAPLPVPMPSPPVPAAGPGTAYEAAPPEGLAEYQQHYDL